MRDFHRLAVAALPADEADATGRCGTNRRPYRALEIEPLVHRAATGEGIAAIAEAARNHADVRGGNLRYALEPAFERVHPRDRKAQAFEPRIDRAVRIGSQLFKRTTHRAALGIADHAVRVETQLAKRIRGTLRTPVRILGQAFDERQLARFDASQRCRFGESRANLLDRLGGFGCAFADAAGDFQILGQCFANDFEELHPAVEVFLHRGDIVAIGIDTLFGRGHARFAVEQNDDDEREGEFGNPALDPYRAWNFDASLEYYMNSNGALTGAVFYKDIKDYIVDTVQRDGVFNGIAYDEAVIPINGDEAKVFGFEASFAQSLSFLPSPLDGLLVQANYTYTDATGTVFTDGDQTDPREIPLPATARHTFNVVLGYDKGPLDIRLAGTYRDRYLDEIADEAALDRYVDNHFQLDLSAKYKLTKNIKLFYEWVNINNAKYYAYNNFGGQRNPYQFEEYSWTMKGGVRVTF